MKKTITALQNIWLSDNEIKVYFSILENPKSNISNISRKSGIKRTTVYPYLESLLEKWFITKAVKWKIIVYIPENPKNIITIFEKKKKLLEKSIPFLSDLFQNKNNSNIIQVFSWKSAVNNMYDLLAESTTDIYTFFSPERYFKIYSEEDSMDFNMAVYKNNVKLYDLVEDNEVWRNYVKSVSHNAKVLPKDFDNVWMDMLILEDKVIFVSFDTMTAILIQDKTIHSLMKTMYSFIWKGIK